MLLRVAAHTHTCDARRAQDCLCLAVLCIVALPVSGSAPRSMDPGLQAIFERQNLADAVSALEALGVFDLERLNQLTDSDVDAMVESRGLLLFTGRLLKLKRARVISAFQQRAVNERDADGVTALMLAGLSGSSGEVGQLLDQGADVNAQSRGGTTALMLASLKGRTEAIGPLLGKGADVNAQDKGGRTALMYASLGGHTAVVGQLLGRGADLDVEDEDGKTALMYASRNGHADLEQLLQQRSNASVWNWPYMCDLPCRWDWPCTGLVCAGAGLTAVISFSSCSSCWWVLAWTNREAKVLYPSGGRGAV